MDVKRLKTAMWGILTQNPQEDKVFTFKCCTLSFALGLAGFFLVLGSLSTHDGDENVTKLHI